jgi:hypothetical protein
MRTALATIAAVITAQAQSVVLFSVARDTNGISIDPVVLLPSMTNPASPNATEADYKRFELAHYKRGSRLTIYSGAERAGAASVRESEVIGEEGGCRILSARISYNGHTPALAVSGNPAIRGHKSKRRAATAAEAASLKRLAIDWLREAGLDAALLQQGRLGPVVSTEMRPGRHALIGRFDVESKSSIHRLFAIAEHNGQQYRLTLADVAKDEVELDKDELEREYVDQLDLDGDGQDEIVTRNLHYEVWDYSVWRLDPRTGSWTSIYNGGGGGC